MKKWKRILGVVDDLLEILIFDLVFGTRWGRRLAGGLTLTAGLTLYLLSGLIFTPYAPIAFDPIDSAPYIDDATWTSPDGVIATVASEHQVPPDSAARLEAELTKFAEPLAKARQLLASGSPPRVISIPRFKNMRELANLLVARGVWRSSHGEGDEAVRDWLAAARLGLVMVDRSPDRPVLIEGMIRTAIERSAMNAIRWHAEAGKLNMSQKFHIQRYLAHRGRWDRSLAAYMEGERDFFVKIMAQASEKGSLTLDGSFPSYNNLVMPARHADRVVFIERVRDAILQYHTTIIADARARSPREITGADLDRIAAGAGRPVTTGIVDFAHGLVSQERAAAYVTRWVLDIAHPNITKAGERIDALEDEVRAVEKLTATR